MRSVLAITAREVRSFFVSPIAYVVLTVWLILSGISFYILASWYAQNASTGGSDNPLTPFFGGTVLFYLPPLVFVPVLTMRLLAEERRSGTIEPLLTAPVSDVAVVFGKYLAALVFWVAMWLPTLLYVWITSNYGDVDMGAIAASYLGIFGIGLYYMAIGLAMSALSKNQITAALLTFMVLGALFVSGLLTYVESLSEYHDVLEYISLWGHMQAFAKGVVDSRFVIFDVSLACFFVFLAWRALEGRRWQ